MEIFNKKKDKMVFVRVSKKEAISLIHSLSAQLKLGNPNTDRLESYTKDGTYFSIAVDFEEEVG